MGVVWVAVVEDPAGDSKGEMGSSVGVFSVLGVGEGRGDRACGVGGEGVKGVEDIGVGVDRGDTPPEGDTGVQVGVIIGTG